MGRTNSKNKSQSPSTATHPPYFEMIADAISTLKERAGSSQQAIAKFIEEKHRNSLPANFRKQLSLQLKNLVQSQRLYKVKNSYKISSGDDDQAPGKNKEIAVTKKKEKTKMLSQIKTPEALKKKNKAVTATAKEKVKLLSQVKTPEAMKKKKKPINSTKPIKSSRPIRKARK